MTAIPVLDQSAEDVELRWTYGNRLNFAWWVEDVDWSGEYTAKVYDRPLGNLLLTFQVVAAYDAVSVPPRTEFTMTNVVSEAVRGNGWWHLDDTALDLTRFSGPVTVRP